MKLQGYSCLLIALIAAIVAAKKKGKLRKTTEFMPEECSRKAENGDLVEVHYTGTLEDGTVFDSSRTEGRDPIQFELGSGKVIPGWEQGIQGMCVGEKRRLVIPPHLGYGDKGAGPIPGDATLKFEVELMSAESPTEPKKYKVPEKPFDFKLMLKFCAVSSIVAYVIYYLAAKMLKDPDISRTKFEKMQKKKK
ncbi:FK506-binding protein 2 [Holothuria leucospilota]|uniref:peptidylprolyl isomerase n=1 Tax=Holothuria leucospilota TaxID=206669 RepID=A0A9Q0YGK8_HOLLE|nr:FK506-binding protein 2 [Holothuria leucospilota]